MNTWHSIKRIVHALVMAALTIFGFACSGTTGPKARPIDPFTGIYMHVDSNAVALTDSLRIVLHFSPPAPPEFYGTANSVDSVAWGTLPIQGSGSIQGRHWCVEGIFHGGTHVADSVALSTMTFWVTVTPVSGAKGWQTATSLLFPIDLPAPWGLDPTHEEGLLFSVTSSDTLPVLAPVTADSVTNPQESTCWVLFN